MRSNCDLVETVKLEAKKLSVRHPENSPDFNWSCAAFEARHCARDVPLDLFRLEVETRAYTLFEERGRAHGHDLEDYLQAWLEQLRGRCADGEAPISFSSSCVFDPRGHSDLAEKISRFEREVAKLDPSIKVVVVGSPSGLQMAFESQKQLTKTIYLVPAYPPDASSKAIFHDLLIGQGRPFHTDGECFRAVSADPRGLHEASFPDAPLRCICDLYI